LDFVKPEIAPSEPPVCRNYVLLEKVGSLGGANDDENNNNDNDDDKTF